MKLLFCIFSDLTQNITFRYYTIVNLILLYVLQDTICKCITLMYIDIVDELNSRYKSRIFYSYSTYRKVYEPIPETFKILCNSKILDIKGYNSSSLRSTWLNQKRKCLFFNWVIQKASNLIVEEGFFTTNYKKRKNRGHFQFFSIYKKKNHLLSL